MTETMTETELYDRLMAGLRQEVAMKPSDWQPIRWYWRWYLNYAGTRDVPGPLLDAVLDRLEREGRLERADWWECQNHVGPNSSESFVDCPEDGEETSYCEECDDDIEPFHVPAWKVIPSAWPELGREADRIRGLTPAKFIAHLRCLPAEEETTYRAAYAAYRVLQDRGSDAP